MTGVQTGDGVAVVTLEFADITTILPQAAPMLLVDRVVWLDPGRALHAIKTVSGSEPCYLGLPPGLPPRRYAYPVSLLMESFGQAAALLWHSRQGRLAGEGELLMFAAARDVEVIGHAYPGDVLRHEVRLEATVADTAFATGDTWVRDRRVATMGTFVAVVRPAETLAGDIAPVAPTHAVTAAAEHVGRR